MRAHQRENLENLEDLEAIRHRALSFIFAADLVVRESDAAKDAKDEHFYPRLKSHAEGSIRQFQQLLTLLDHEEDILQRDPTHFNVEKLLTYKALLSTFENEFSEAYDECKVALQKTAAEQNVRALGRAELRESTELYRSAPLEKQAKALSHLLQDMALAKSAPLTLKNRLKNNSHTLKETLAEERFLQGAVAEEKKDQFIFYRIGALFKSSPTQLLKKTHQRLAMECEVARRSVLE